MLRKKEGRRLTLGKFEPLSNKCTKPHGKGGYLGKIFNIKHCLNVFIDINQKKLK